VHPSIISQFHSKIFSLIFFLTRFILFLLEIDTQAGCTQVISYRHIKIKIFANQSMNQFETNIHLITNLSSLLLLFGSGGLGILRFGFAFFDILISIFFSAFLFVFLGLFFFLLLSQTLAFTCFLEEFLHQIGIFVISIVFFFNSNFTITLVQNINSFYV